MKKTIQAITLLLSINTTCLAQTPDTAGTIRPFSNTPGYDFPRIDKEHRAVFLLKAPNAQNVQVDLGKRYDMIKLNDSMWTVTTQALLPGFLYYFLFMMV